MSPPPSANRFRPAATSWLARVLINLCRDEARRIAVRRRLSDAAAASPAAGPGDPTATASRPATDDASLIARQEVHSALSILPSRRRAVVVLYELEEMPTRDIGRLLGMAEVTVRWHLFRGRRQLLNFLRGNGGPEEAR